MIRLRMKKYNMILIEYMQKYQPYDQAKLINMNFEKQRKTIEDQVEKQMKVI